ncbi:hypothetical protein N4G70_12310 [Streptomyces sp. ASQP_92]|uniref:hypothetical protein n=1 Tax=Streptomyces sp. ASQP_92 TaxID=2979116 RepID=UPI0021BEE3F9|nr:hypothetical protein [Streptomyces sp. ASQP_92]MCT9089655.1 hypothetical protein [Streptomyces sp. ASQP_92]
MRAHDRPSGPGAEHPRPLHGTAPAHPLQHRAALRPAEAAVLQRVAGNAAVVRAIQRTATVQRTETVAPGDPGYPQKRKRTILGKDQDLSADDEFFVSQGERDGSYFENPAELTPNLVRAGSVPLRISSARDLAIEDGVNEPKVFFATSTRIAEANAKLKGAIRLVRTSKYLHLTGEQGERKLYLVEPKVQKKGQESRQGLAVRTPQRCNEMAAFVSGAFNPATPGIEKWHEGLARLIDSIDGSSLAAGYAAAAAAGRDAYLAYGSNLSARFQALVQENPAAVDRALGALGMSEFMPTPNPGDILVTVGYGDAAQEEQRKQNRAAGTDNTFEYHFGTAIASSGRDYITMENYARRDPDVGLRTGSSGDPLFFFRMYIAAPGTDSWHSRQVATDGFIGAIISANLSG